jgi:hypothetical protein
MMRLQDGGQPLRDLRASLGADTPAPAVQPGRGFPAAVSPPVDRPFAVDAFARAGIP